MSRYIKKRRTKKEMAEIRDAIYFLLASDNPMTVRQVFYRLVSNGVIQKTENEYKRTVTRLLTEMRLNHIDLFDTVNPILSSFFTENCMPSIPFSWIADNTRWMRKPKTYSGLEHMLEKTAIFYRRDLWEKQDVHVEIWLEKEALAGVLVEITEKYDVPLMVTRGYPSITFLHTAAQEIDEIGKPAYLYYFGDYDPSGVDISRQVNKRINEFCFTPINFERVAVTREQIGLLNLPTRPTKKTDSRAKNFHDESVEVDAIEPNTLRAMVEDCITQHIDGDEYERLMVIEKQERESLKAIASNFRSTQ